MGSTGVGKGGGIFDGAADSATAPRENTCGACDGTAFGLHAAVNSLVRDDGLRPLMLPLTAARSATRNGLLAKLLAVAGANDTGVGRGGGGGGFDGWSRDGWSVLHALSRAVSPRAVSPRAVDAPARYETRPGWSLQPGVRGTGDPGDAARRRLPSSGRSGISNLPLQRCTFPHERKIPFSNTLTANRTTSQQLP